MSDVQVTFSREFKFSPDGHTVLTYPPGPAEVSEICAEIAKSDGALVHEEGGSYDETSKTSEPPQDPAPPPAPEKAAAKGAPEKKA